MGKLSDQVNGALDTSNGYFAARAVTYDNQISDLTDTITKQTSDLTDYQTSLQDKFNQMDIMIANLNSQLATMKSVLGIS